MNTPKTAIRLPQHLVQEMRILAHKESLRLGKTVSWAQLMALAAERYIRRYGEREVVSAGQ